MRYQNCSKLQINNPFFLNQFKFKAFSFVIDTINRHSHFFRIVNSNKVVLIILHYINSYLLCAVCTKYFRNSILGAYSIIYLLEKFSTHSIILQKISKLNNRSKFSLNFETEIFPVSAYFNYLNFIVFAEVFSADYMFGLYRDAHIITVINKNHRNKKCLNHKLQYY